MTPAVRNPTGACVEESNCNWELATVCAFNNASTANQVSFLACMDDINVIPPSPLLKGLNAAVHCAPASSIDADALKSCYAGAEGKTLLDAASKAWNKAAPGKSFVPKLLVDDKEIRQHDYATISKALCAAGSTASVCNKQDKQECYI